MSHWTKEEVILLDKYDNATVAKITGRSEKAVAAKRSYIKGNEPFPMTQCRICGKLFYMPDPAKWVYKREYKGRLYHMCSYHCMRAWDNGKKRKEKVAK